MALDIHWTLTVSVPQLDTLHQTLVELGAQFMADFAGMRTELTTLVAQQARISDELAAQLTIIAQEIQQRNADVTSQADLDALAGQIREAAQQASAQADQIRAASEQIAGIVPDAPPQP